MGKDSNESHIIKSFKRICKQQLAIDCKTINPDLKMSQIKTLSAFNGSDCLSKKELAANSGITVARMTAAVNSLIKEGSVERGKDDRDGRRAIVRLTPQGKKLRNRIAANRRRAAKTIYAHLNNKDRLILLNSLDAACKILEKIARR
jgi:MarR family transcriptional regulator, temperature-dependent positive regulator of motility